MSICRDLRSNKNCSYSRNVRDIIHGKQSLDHYYFEKPIDAEELINFCKDKRYCPYFLARHLLKKAPIIVCNFQWIFNPEIFRNIIE